MRLPGSTGVSFTGFPGFAGRCRRHLPAGQGRAEIVSLVFWREARLAATPFVRLQGRLYDVMSLDEDGVLFLPMCPLGGESSRGARPPVEVADAKNAVVGV